MTKQECKRVVYRVAAGLLRNFISQDGYCPVTTSGQWTDMPENEYVRLIDAFREVADALAKKGNKP